MVYVKYCENLCQRGSWLERRINHVYYRRLYLVSKECGLHTLFFDLSPLLSESILILNRFWLFFFIGFCFWFTEDCWDPQIKQYSSCTRVLQITHRNCLRIHCCTFFTSAFYKHQKSSFTRCWCQRVSPYNV